MSAALVSSVMLIPIEHEATFFSPSLYCSFSVLFVWEWSCVLDSTMVHETYLSTLLSSALPLSYLNTQFYKQFKLSSTPTVEEPLKSAYGQDSTCRDFRIDVKKETTGPKTLKTEAFVNAWTHKMWHGDSAAMIFLHPICVARVHVTFRKREHLWLVSSHCVWAGPAARLRGSAGMKACALPVTSCPLLSSPTGQHLGCATLFPGASAIHQAAGLP